MRKVTHRCGVLSKQVPNYDKHGGQYSTASAATGWYISLSVQYRERSDRMVHSTRTIIRIYFRKLRVQYRERSDRMVHFIECTVPRAKRPDATLNAHNHQNLFRKLRVQYRERSDRMVHFIECTVPRAKRPDSTFNASESIPNSCVYSTASSRYRTNRSHTPED